MTVIVLALIITLATGSYLLVSNLQQFTVTLPSTNQISLFLKTDVDSTQSNQLINKLRNHALVQSVNLISKEQALEEFKINSGFGVALDALVSNPLPVVIEVLPKENIDDVPQLLQLANEFQHLSEVDFAQLDMQWAKRLQELIAAAQRASALLNLFLLVSVLFITANTVRLELQRRRDEVIISQLVGATTAFIRRPFLYSGFWLGFLASIMAWFIVTITLLTLKPSVEALSVAYQNIFHLVFLSVSETLALLFICSITSVLGSWLLVTYQLRHVKPDS
jgi:cell division transport system permease protein